MIWYHNTLASEYVGVSSETLLREFELDIKCERRISTFQLRKRSVKNQCM